MRNVWLLLTMVATLLPARLAAQDKTESAKEQLAHKELRALRDAVVEAINKNDLDRLSTFLDDDVVVTWQNSEVSRGPKEVRAYYDRMMKGPDRIVQSIAIDPVVDAPANLYGDDTAVGYGGSKDHYKLTDGRDFPVESRWSATVVKKDGKWKIASFHASVNMFDSPIMRIKVWEARLWTGIPPCCLGWLAAGIHRGPTAPAEAADRAMMFPGLSLTADERRLLDRAACWPRAPLAELTGAALRQLAAAEGLDFATALLYDQLRRSPVHGPFINQLEAMTECRTDADVAVVIVPGAFYRERPDTGADGRFVRDEAARVGCPTALIPLPSFGPPAECGRLICNALLRHDGPPVVLVSLSKGGTDVRAALDRPEADEAFARVVAWVSLSGIIRGTPLVDWLRRRRLRTLFIRMMFWLRGYPFAVLRALDREPDDAPALRLPAHLQVVHVAGFPLQRHLTNRLLRRGHKRLAPLGPNDGVALLADVCRLPGVVCPIWGADHYLRLAGRDVRGLFARILCLVTAAKEHHDDPAPLAGR